MKKNAKKVNKGEELMTAIRAISAEKNIPQAVLLEALEAALISAYKRNFSAAQNVLVNIDHENGDIKVYAQKEVVEVVEDELIQISLDDAKAHYGAYEIGDTVNIEVTPADFGRIAAQTAKQVIMQKLKEVERENRFHY